MEELRRLQAAGRAAALSPADMQCLAAFVHITGRNVAVAAAFCGAVADLALNHDQSGPLGTVGVIPGVVRAMRVHVTAPAVQSAGTNALCWLAGYGQWNSGYPNRKLISDAGGLDCLYAASSLPVTHQVFFYALNYLHSSPEGKAAMEKGGKCRTVLTALRASHPATAANVDELLAKLPPAPAPAAVVVARR